jgi:hypothetical protein
LIYPAYRTSISPIPNFGLSRRAAVLDHAFPRWGKWTARLAAAHRRFRERQAGHASAAAPQIDQVVVVEWFGLPPQSQSRCPLGPSNGLATTTSHAACAPGNSAKWHLAKGFSRQVRARF